MKNFTSFFQNQIWILFLGMTALSSCDDPIDVSLDQGPVRLVVDGWLYQNLTTPTTTPDTIKLRYTSSYFSNSPAPKASHGFVTITDNTGLVDTLLEVSPGQYITRNTVREVGRSYKLTVKIDGETYEAFTELKLAPLIDSVKAIYVDEDRGPQGKGFYLYYFGPENIGPGDFYRFNLYENGRFLNSPDDLAFTDDRFLKDEVYIDSLEINFAPFKEGDTIRTETLSISEDAFYFFAEMQTQINNGGLFAQPPANVRSNIKNVNPKGPEAQGYFGASGLTWYKTVCKKP